jgi:hypothetical protein
MTREVSEKSDAICSIGMTYLWWDICIQTFKTWFQGTNNMHEGVCIQIEYEHNVAAE